MSNRAHPPDPKRFETYVELKDGSGFTVKGCDFVFKYDRYGGWYDQYANYYDANGQPDEPPSDSEHSDHLSRSQESYSDHEEDEFEREFGGPKNYEDDEDEEDIYVAKIGANLAVLHSYPADRPLRVNFRNIAYISKRQEVFNYFKGKVGGVLNVVFLENQKKQFNGNGYFVVENIKAAQQLVRLEGEVYNSREVHFSIVDVQDFLLDPLQNEELFPDFTQKHSSKKYITKGPPQPRPQQPVKQEAPKEQKPKPEVKIETKVESKPKVEQKPELDPESEASYRFLKTAFPLKSSFKEWIKQNNFDNNKDIIRVQKIEGNENYALVTMKRKVFNKLNGTHYNGTKIIFDPQTK